MTPTTELSVTPQPWSAKATLILGVVVILAYILLTTLNLFIGVGIELSAQGIAPEQAEAAGERIINALALDGDFNTINYIVCFAIFTPVILWIAKKRKISTAVAYLGFENMPDKKTFIHFTLFYMAYAAFFYVISFIFKIETPASMIALYQSTDYLWLSLFAVVICAPIIEEIFFRGFLFKGWEHSRLGTIGTILLTSLLFVLIHAGQYDLTLLVMISPLALLLGFSRYKTQSIYIPIYIHFLNNVYGSLEMYFFMN